MPHTRLLGIALLLAMTAGCGKSAPAGTGAREAAVAYYEALEQADWPAAYALLDAASRKRITPDQFARLGQRYRQGLGFQPASVHIRSCEEHGDEAIAHVTLTGKGSAGQVSYRDAVSLRSVEGAWRVVLPPGFGQAKPR